jgi:hypothetical protein
MTAAASPAPLAFPSAAADRLLLQQVMEQERVTRSAGGPDWTAYLVDLARAALDALPDVMAPARDALAGLGLSMDTIATVLLWLVAVLLAALAAMGLVRLWRRQRPAEPPADEPARRHFASPVRDRDDWRALLDGHVRDGAVAEALEAAWWWLAASVSRGPVDPSWTSRELLARSGRPDLGGPAAFLDRLTYGPLRPETADLRRLVDALDGAL